MYIYIYIHIYIYIYIYINNNNNTNDNNNNRRYYTIRGDSFLLSGPMEARRRYLQRFFSLPVSGSVL